MDRLIVTAEVRGPLVTGGGFMTFDALLAAAVFTLTSDVSAAHDSLPLARSDGMYHASAAVFEPRDTNKRAIVQGMRPDLGLLPWLKKNASGQVHTRFSNMPDNILNTYRSMDIDRVTWYCEGDAERIDDLLKVLPMIGKKRSTEVVRWQIDDGELDGISGYAGEPLRPVPVWLWSGARHHVMADVCWRPAYWDPRGKAACYVG